NLESINQYLMDVLQKKFDEYGSVENAFLEVMHRELDGLDDGVLLSDKDESEGREEGSVPEKKVKTNIKTNPQTDELF
ncbi:MAG: hypothetical protein Q4E61_01790, partial [Alphaproteobacteria bacterium]|nr:hypothetical protein [Alphaproteobacteria bacterium]